MKYHYLSNQEVDYDQVMSAIANPDIFVDSSLQSGWLPPLVPQVSAIDIADGADSRFLLSTGPFDLDIGESIPLTIAVFGGTRLHIDPANFSSQFPNPSDFLDPARIRDYRSHLDFRGLIESSRMARRVFDNENIVSPVLCFVFDPREPIFDSLRAHGDGNPDFRGGQCLPLFRRWNLQPAKGK